MPESFIEIKGNYIEHLDGLRGVAILLVMFSHLFYMIPGFGVGYIGVDLFFILSGFLITNILYANENSKNKYASFYIRRTLRIFPVYYLVLIIIYLFPLSRVFTFYDVNNLISPIYFVFYVQNWHFSWYGWPKEGIIAHFWSLAVEEQFYLFYPFLFFNLKKYRLSFIISLIILSTIIRFVFRDHFVFAFTSTITKSDSLMAGALMSYCYNSLDINKIKYLSTRNLVLTGLTGFAGFALIIFKNKSISHDFASVTSIGFTLIILFFASLILLTFKDNNFGSGLRNSLNNGFFKFTGKISYGLYVYHFIIIYFAERYIYSVCNCTNLQILAGVLSFGLSYLVAYLSFRFIEMPIINLKKYFSYR